MISPYSESSQNYDEAHPELQRNITWVPEQAYSAPVEISVYNSRVAIISFGEEAVAMLIESPQVADALRQIFAMAKVGAKQMMKSGKSKKPE
jgi:hypothetical protein